MNNARFFIFLFSTFLVLTGECAFAFPELIRHGYATCINCHVSPSGGGTINDYGRSFAGEGISTWFRPDEESILHGLIKRKKIPSWLSLGGDVRAVQVYEDNKTVQRAQSIMMQADFEFAVRMKKWTFDLAFGRIQTNPAVEPKPGSRRYFVMYSPNDRLNIRAGRFFPAYGLNIPDHIVATRMYIKLNQGQEAHAIEGSWITDSWSVLGTYFQGPVDVDKNVQDTGEALQVSYAFKDTYKVGANVLDARSNSTTRLLYGLFATLGFSPELYYLSEVDWLSSTPTSGGKTTQGFFNFNRLGYEIKRGVHLLGNVEYWQTDTSSPTTTNERYGVGTQLFPRPHFDIQALWTKWKIKSAGETFNDYAWVVFHYYF